MLTKSFYGEEDITLEANLTKELPGILNWAIEGRKAMINYQIILYVSSLGKIFIVISDGVFSTFYYKWYIDFKISHIMTHTRARARG